MKRKPVNQLTGKLLMGMLSSLIMMAFLLPASAMEKEPWMFNNIVEVDFVISKISVPMAEDVMIIDARPYETKYVKGFIPGAVSIPFSKFDEKKNLLPGDKKTLLIFYCGGLKCKLSHKSAKKAVEMGYTNVKVFAKGFPEYKNQPGVYPAVTAEQVAAKVAENKALIVDARPKMNKYDQGHIPSAISLPFSQFDELKGKLPRDLQTPVVFYCGGLKCRLSHKSAEKALAMGYKNVSVYTRGYPDWQKQFGNSGAIAVKAGEVEGSIELERFKAILEENPGSITLIDVRDADEFAKGHFKTAINIPVDGLEPEIKGFSSGKPVVFVCSTGSRSGEGYYMVKEVRPGLEAYYVEATIDFKKDGSYLITKN